MNYIYPKLPAVKTYYLLRIGGNGLANCMFVLARAVVLSDKHNFALIEPTWFNLSPGTYIRRQKDKRHYLGLFNSTGINGIKKVITLSLKKREHTSEISDKKTNTVFEVEGLGNYFEDFLNYQTYVTAFFYNITKDDIKTKIKNFNFTNCIAVHIRLGDYTLERRTPLDWYVKKMEEYVSRNVDKKKFLIFTDGKIDEIRPIMEYPNTEIVFFGNALADIWAISKCEFLIGSDSTFSAWGAFLGQVPCVFYRKHFGRILNNSENEIVENKDKFVSQL